MKNMPYDCAISGVIVAFRDFYSPVSWQMVQGTSSEAVVPNWTICIFNAKDFQIKKIVKWDSARLFRKE